MVAGLSFVYMENVPTDKTLRMDFLQKMKTACWTSWKAKSLIYCSQGILPTELPSFYSIKRHLQIPVE